MSAPKNAPKHTPGPWKSVVLRDGARIEADGSSIAWIGPDDTRECADGRIVEVMTKRAVANTHLIAAAPDLLALARDYLASGDECVRGDDSCVEPDSCGVCDLKRSAQAAIAKAEGRS